MNRSGLTAVCPSAAQSSPGGRHSEQSFRECHRGAQISDGRWQKGSIVIRFHMLKLGWHRVNANLAILGADRKPFHVMRHRNRCCPVKSNRARELPRVLSSLLNLPHYEYSIFMNRKEPLTVGSKCSIERPLGAKTVGDLICAICLADSRRWTGPSAAPEHRTITRKVMPFPYHTFARSG